MSLTASQEAALLDRLRDASGSKREEVFDIVFESLRVSIFRLCRNLTRSREEAEDALQECFLAIHQALPSFRGEARLSTWAYRIAIHAALRVKAKQPRHVAPLTEASHLADGRPGPDDLAASRQGAQRLQRALDELSEEHRIVLSLFALDGLGHEEIAQVLGVPSGTVWSRLHAARKRLAREVGGGSAGRT